VTGEPGLYYSEIGGVRLETSRTSPDAARATSRNSEKVLEV